MSIEDIYVGFDLWSRSWSPISSSPGASNLAGSTFPSNYWGVGVNGFPWDGDGNPSAAPAYRVRSDLVSIVGGVETVRKSNPGFAYSGPVPVRHPGGSTFPVYLIARVSAPPTSGGNWTAQRIRFQWRRQGTSSWNDVFTAARTELDAFIGRVRFTVPAEAGAVYEFRAIHQRQASSSWFDILENGFTAWTAIGEFVTQRPLEASEVIGFTDGQQVVGQPASSIPIRIAMRSLDPDNLILGTTTFDHLRKAPVGAMRLMWRYSEDGVNYDPWTVRAAEAYPVAAVSYPDADSNDRPWSRERSGELLIPGDANTGLSFNTFNIPSLNSGNFVPGVYQFRFDSMHVRDFRANHPLGSVPPVGAPEWVIGAPKTLVLIAPTPSATPISPSGAAIYKGAAQRFVWNHYSPIGADQEEFQLLYREPGETTWLPLTAEIVSSAGTYVLPDSALDDIDVGRYEWSVRTYDGTSWSDPGQPLIFWRVTDPGSLIPPPSPIPGTRQPALGCGETRVFLYDKGGMVRRGELTGFDRVSYNRVRDDLSICTVDFTDPDPACIPLLRVVSTWVHELVVERDGKRVWEGPVTLVRDAGTAFQIRAHDVFAWARRRIIRTGYSNLFQIAAGEIIHEPRSVVETAQYLLATGMAPDDPNVLGFVTAIHNPDDALQSRNLPPYAETVYGEIDDMAARAGLDYTVVGRRIILWDANHNVGILPEMDSNSFIGAVPIVTEYGMEASSISAVTNGTGVYGLVENQDAIDRYGLLEFLISTNNEVDAAAEITLTPEARLRLEESLTSQAERAQAKRYPAPVTIRIPENSRLNPELEIGFDQLIPGVWIPIRADHTIRKGVFYQKLDQVRVTVTEDGEEIAISCGPTYGVVEDETGGEI